MIVSDTVRITPEVLKLIVGVDEFKGTRRVGYLGAGRPMSMEGLMRHFLPDGAFGSFDLRDENRLFRLSLHAGEAFRVLEVLLGDLDCMLDSPKPESALPGLFIHNRSREADMSTGPYENFLLLVDRGQREKYAGHTPPFQYIVTTNTPSPSSLYKVSCLTSGPSFDEELLLGRRFVSQQAALR